MAEKTAREVLEDIANFPLEKKFELDEFGEIKHGTSSHGPGYAAWRNQRVAQEWLKANPKT